MFWLVATILTAMVFVPLAMVMLRGGPQEGPAEKDIALYKDQLAEVDRDLARGTLAEAEAEAARAEVARRLLAADRRAGQGTPGAAGGRGAGLSWGVRAAGLATLAVALVGAVALYSQVGVPGYRDWPLAERLRAAQNFRATRPGQTQAETQVTPPKIPRDAELEDLVAQLRTAVADNPNDLRGLGLLARNEMRLGNFTRAHEAQARLIAALGGRAGPEEYTDLAEMMVLAADGYVSPEAETALTRALRADPRNPRARYYSGLSLAQTGRPDIAYRMWAGLLQDSGPDDPWVALIRRQLPRVAAAAGVPIDEALALAPPPPLPGQVPLQVPEDMPDPRAMVSSLSDRLAREGGPPEDWARLIRSYAVLGERGAASTVWNEARKTFADNAEAMRLLTQAAREAQVAQ